jgi:selenocysteine lyase/cysteine desulfurase
VNGLREFARAAGTPTTYLPGSSPELRVDENALDFCLRQADRGRHNLFAYPAQSNFSGVRHPQEWVEPAHAAGWDVLVDCAAYVPTNRLDLSEWHPDFVPISFYKLLGYPTGVGCLLVRRQALAKLRRPWFAGGTIVAVSVQGDWHVPAGDGSAFEDGTVNYLTLPAVEQGLAYVDGSGSTRSTSASPA